MEGKRDTGIPEFESLEEEKEYWEARGPLAEGHKGRINKPKSAQRRSSFLAVRLTGEELTHLRDMAAKQGLGTSTLARLLLTRAIEKEDCVPEVVNSDDIMSRMYSNLSQTDKDKLESFIKDVAIGDTDNPLALIFAGKRKDWEESTLLFLKCLLGLLGVRVVAPKMEDLPKAINDYVKV